MINFIAAFSLTKKYKVLFLLKLDRGIAMKIGVSTSLKNICVIVFLKCYKVCYNLATRW